MASKLPTLSNQFAHMNVNNNGVLTNTNVSIDQQRNQVLINPSTAAPTTMASLAGTILEFRIENALDLIKDVYLKVKLSNSSGGNFIHAIPDFWIENLQILGDNGGKILYQQPDNYLQVIADNIWRSRENHEATAIQYRGYTNNTYATTQVTVADTATPTYYINLAEQFFEVVNFRSFATVGNLLVRLHFAPSSRLITSGTCNISSIQLRCVGFQESEAQRKLVLKNAMNPQDNHFYGYRKHTVTQSLAASTSYDIRLSGINGHVAMLAFVLRRTSEISNPSTQGNVYAVASYEILDAAGKALTGHSPVDMSDMHLSYSMQFPNLFLSNYNAHIHTFCKGPVQALLTGSWNGGVEMNGFHTLRITTPAGFTPTTYEIVAYALVSQTLQQRKGSLTVTGF
jgi:hypothetical protein